MKIESEKTLEKKFERGVKKLGGWSFKLLSTHINGMPDRICLMPGGIVFFAEIKTTKEKPRKIQLFIHSKIRKLGFNVFVIDCSEHIKSILRSYE